MNTAAKVKLTQEQLVFMLVADGLLNDQQKSTFMQTMQLSLL